MKELTILTYSISLWLMAAVCIKAEQQDYTIKIVGCGGTESSYAGRLEMLFLGEWGTICGDTFNNKAASVACYSLGYQRGRAIFIHNEYGGPAGKPIILQAVNCFGNETHLDGCQHPPIGRTNCTHDQDVYVACEAYKYADGHDVLGYQIRLCDNEFNCATEDERTGLLQIKYNGSWGTVCGTNTSFIQPELKVACRGVLHDVDEAHYDIVGTFRYDRKYEVNDSVPIWLGAPVDCIGTERNLGSCEHPAWGTNTCHHYNDVWVKCDVISKDTGRVLSDEELDEVIRQSSAKKTKRSGRRLHVEL